jgi:hypothetical protein
MSKRKSQVERAVEALEEKRAAILTKANTEAGALQQAIQELKSQVVKRVKKTRPEASQANP